MKILPLARLGCCALISCRVLPILPAQPVNGVEIIGGLDPAATAVPAVAGPEIWKDPSAPLNSRVRDLVSRMSLAEKASQLRADACALPRLGIPAYSYRNEGIHGVAGTGAGIATVFPQTIGMAATWDAPLIRAEADIVATEARAKFNDYAGLHHGDSTLHHGLSLYAPNINIFRDPRWGRGQETYGEDPFLTAQLGVAFIDGLQGDDPRYVKALGGAKHFAVHSGPEPGRAHFNVTPSERDLYDTYLPAFEAAVREGHVGSVMASYNALDGVPACANPFLLTQLLRGQWGFGGFVVSDGGAIQNVYKQHKYVATAEEAAAAAVKAGCDLFSSTVAGRPRQDYEALGRLVQKGLLSVEQIDEAVGRTLAARFRLGLFDPPSLVPWSKLTLADNDTREHRALALKVARESIVLLKNDGLLPLDRDKIKHLAVIGPNANSASMLLGNYEGAPSHSVTILDGIKEIAGTNIEVTFAPGCPLALKNDNSNLPAPEMLAQALAAAKSADAIVFVGGIDSSLEAESAKVDFQGFLGGDRTRIELPPPQLELLQALAATGKPVIFVNCSGSAMAMPWAAANLPAVLQAWYPGEEGGRAVAEVLFGEVNPAGRLPVTFYRATSDLPAFDDYSMANRTYRYFRGSPLYAFGHGLSYTRFEYRDARLDAARYRAGDTVMLVFALKNGGGREGDEVAQVYFRRPLSADSRLNLALAGFVRVHLAPGQETNVTVDIPVERLRSWNPTLHRYMIEPGDYELQVGAASDDPRLRLKMEIAATP